MAVLEALEKALCRPADTSGDIDESSVYLRTLAICGPGGMGKAQIASEFVHRHKAQFDTIFWVHADEPSKIAQDFNHIAITLGLIAEDSAEARDHILTQDVVRGWLAHILKSYKKLEHRKSEEASFLLIFDNVDC